MKFEIEKEWPVHKTYVASLVFLNL